jgi:carbon-monoxide dehydrogenase iron sulfur subunit
MKEDVRIFFRPERCVGCLSCLLACQMEALGASEIEGVPVGVKPDERMMVTYHQGTPWLWKCQQCASAPCAEACISGSLRQEPGGVSHDPERCVGCGSCSLVCPFGMIRPLEGQDRMTKCNLCREEAVPPCVRACMTKALVLEDSARLAQIKRKAFALESRRQRGFRDDQP